MSLSQDLLFQDAQVHFQNQDGWVRIFADEELHTHPQLSLYLSRDGFKTGLAPLG